ncbi:MAG: choice-of-anchor D domain-containing protein [Myxococcales bacterium]|nr:choice-of-anchor D domain-containing protein [Myxococcales bacterium]
MTLRSLLFALVATVAATACYDTPRPSCAFLCGTDSSCPGGYYCAGDGWCKLDGVAETFVCEAGSVDAAMADAAPDGDVDAPDVDAAVDAPEIDALELDAPTDAPTDAPLDAAVAALQIITAAPLDFGDVVETQAAIMPVMVRNGGGAASSALTVTVTGAAYTLVAGASDTCTGMTLAPAATCTFEVRFAPSAPGAAAGVASAMATSGGMVSINLTGVGTASLTAPATIAFGSLATTTTASMDITVTNAGAGTSGTIATAAPAAPFSITADTCAAATVPAAGTCTISVEFAPTATGDATGTITLTATPGGPRTIGLTGTGI